MSPLNRPGARHALTQRAAATRPPDPRTPPQRTPQASLDVPAEGVLYTAEQAAARLQVRPSWLRRKAAARAVPCRYVGKHLRFSLADIHAIADASAQTPRGIRTPSTRD